MYWRQYKTADETRVKNFLTHWEWKNLSLSRYFREESESPVKWIRTSPFKLGEFTPEDPGPSGLVYQKSGILHPLLAEGVSPYELLDEISFSPSSVKVIMGEALAVEAVEQKVGRPLRERIIYDLLVHIGDKQEMDPPFADLQLRRLTPADTELFFPMQKAYEIEEVLLENSLFNENICKAHLKSTLKKEKVFGLFYKNHPIAKGGTNARGYKFSQVGGVYTDPNYRNRGIAQYLMNHLIRDEWKKNRGLVLFVKKSNLPARVLYGKGGFKKMSDYRITYYR